MIEYLGGGNGVDGEHGETDLDESLVALVLDPIDGDRDESKEKFSSNMLLDKEGGGPSRAGFEF